MKKLLLIILLFICPSAIAFDKLITAGGYNYSQGIVVNWDYIDNLTPQKKNIQKTIIIDSFSVKNRKKLEKTNTYVFYQPNYNSPSTYKYKDEKKNEVKKETQKKLVIKEVKKEQSIEQPQINSIPTKNIVVEQPRFIEEKKEIKNKLIVTKDIIQLDLTPNTKNKNQQIEVKNNLENQYVVNNPFEDEFDSPSNIENVITPKQKKKQAPNYNPLLRFPLSEYTVKGLVTSPEGNRALVTTAQGNYFYVKEGEFIGMNNGVIREIKNNSIVILERDRRIEIIVSSSGIVSNR